ncbi:hypothetical protein K2224_20660 [Streptomyces sp. BHT-5-2]|uniref:hypothetical protein n=1 Tax=Streptomyces sp. BHT-5-2 TaxID=2866715 RepID=UPI001C8D26AB|nr:hypothetical protein [Streptomyces sp. BHT-5-2]QZL05252.1 hypothetical protein K2224_20660 [Streptomyces sp. BHT-5-2]
MNPWPRFTLGAEYGFGRRSAAQRATAARRRKPSEIYARIGIALREVDTDEASAHYQPGNECPPVTRIIIDDRPPATAARDDAKAPRIRRPGRG